MSLRESTGKDQTLSIPSKNGEGPGTVGLFSPPTERIEEGERLLFAQAEGVLRGPQAAYNLVASHIARRYSLGPDDRVDTETGEILRGSRGEG